MVYEDMLDLVLELGGNKNSVRRIIHNNNIDGWYIVNDDGERMKFFDIERDDLIQKYYDLVEKTKENNRQKRRVYNSISAIARKYNVHNETINHICRILKFELIKESGQYSLTDEQMKQIDEFIENAPNDKPLKQYLGEITNMEKYGCKHYMQKEEYRQQMSVISTNNAKERMEKAVVTRKERYGDTNQKLKEFYANLTDEERKEYHQKRTEKRWDTINKKYGSHETYVEHVQEAIKETVSEKYGENVTNVFQLENVKRKIQEARLNNIAELERKYDATLKSTLEREYGQGWDLYLEGIERIYVDPYVLIPNKEIPKIEKYAEEGKKRITSRNEKYLAEFISHYCEIVENDRNLIKPKELDIVVPSLNIAFEYDGIRWHWDDSESKAIKQTLTRSIGIKLYHIDNYMWMYKTEATKSFIKNIINKSDIVVNASDYNVQKTTFEIAKEWFDVNSIFDITDGYTYYGLFDNALFDNDCVMMCVFKDNKLINFSYKLNTKVNDGLVYMLNKIGFDEIEYEMPNDLYDINDFIALGFEHICSIDVDYCYVDGNFGRDVQKKYNKDIVTEEFIKYLNDYDENISFEENLLNNKIHRFYDSGKELLIYKK